MRPLKPGDRPADGERAIAIHFDHDYERWYLPYPAGDDEMTDFDESRVVVVVDDDTHTAIVGAHYVLEVAQNQLGSIVFDDEPKFVTPCDDYLPDGDGDPEDAQCLNCNRFGADHDRSGE